jgi:hypothetical protein
MEGWGEVKVLGKIPYMGSEGRHGAGAGGGGVRAEGNLESRGLGSYWEILFQPAFWKDSIELGPQRPLCKDGKHHTF